MSDWRKLLDDLDLGDRVVIEEVGEDNTKVLIKGTYEGIFRGVNKKDWFIAIEIGNESFALRTSTIRKMKRCAAH